MRVVWVVQIMGLLLYSVLVSGQVYAQEYKPYLEKANELYEEDKKDEALANYQKAAELGSARAYYFFADRYNLDRFENYKKGARLGDKKI